MDDDKLTPQLTIAKGLAGSAFTWMLESRERALTFLNASDMEVRLAAVLVCEKYWQEQASDLLADACLSVIGSAANEKVLRVAIDSLGHMRSGAKDAKVAHELAKLVMNPRVSKELQLCAYLALREVWFGIDDPDFLKGVISTVKSALREHPGLFCEDTARKALAPKPGFAEEFWEEADLIDWDFISKRCPFGQPHL